MSETPAWVEMLFKRHHGRGCFDSYNARFHQGLLREHIQPLMDAQPCGSEALRKEALARLCSDDTELVVDALAFLMVVGKSSDVPTIEALTTHSIEGIRNAARACSFELAHKLL